LLLLAFVFHRPTLRLLFHFMPLHLWRLRSLDALPNWISYPLTLRLLRSSALDLLLPALLPNSLSNLLPAGIAYSFATRLFNRTPRSFFLFTLLLFQLACLLPRFPVAAPIVTDFKLTFVSFIRDRLNPKAPGYILSKLRLSWHVAHKHRSFGELLRDPGRQINLPATPCRINDCIS
jgi:hypothetical protein